MQPLTGAKYVRVKQLAEALVRTGHDVRFVRGSTAPGPEKVHAIEAQNLHRAHLFAPILRSF
jgi:hypothetical protein